MSFPLSPPAAWFAPPADMEHDTHISIDENGRVFGYVTHWNRCLLDGSKECWSPPSSPSGYALAHCGDTVTEDGTIVKTANIGGDAGHAPGANGAAGAARWYQDTSTQLARVRYGEDENGIWFAGCLWPDVDEVDIAHLRANGISGDWRWISDQGCYDLIGACMVPVPGLPLYRAASAGEHPDITGRNIDMSASGSSNIPLLNDRARKWDSSAADKAIRKWASSDGSGDESKMNWSKYRSVHFWYDPEKADQFGGYKLLFADVVNGSPKAIFRGVTAVGGVLQGSRGGANIDDVDAVKSRVAGFYSRFSKLFKDDSIVAPWKKNASSGCSECDQEIYIDAKTACASFHTIELADTVGTAFEATLLVEGTPTSDGRLIESGAATWRTPPLSLMLQTKNESGHAGSVIAGRIDRIWRDGYSIMCSGMLDTSEYGVEAARLIKDEMITGVSIDGAIASGNDVSFNEDDGMMTIHKIEIMGATVTPFQAAPDAKIRVASADFTESAFSLLNEINDQLKVLMARDEMIELVKRFEDVE